MAPTPAQKRPTKPSLDATRVAIIEETIRKERRIQRRHYEAERAAGRIAAALPLPPPPPPPRLPSAAQTAAAAAAGFIGTGDSGIAMPAVDAAAAAEEAAATALSAATWVCNPGYIPNRGARLASVAHREFAWDAGAVAALRAAGEFGADFRRRRDGFTKYAEAALRAGRAPGGGGGTMRADPKSGGGK